MNAVMTTSQDLKAPARKVALRAIENVHLAYYEKGGIRDSASRLESQLASAAKHVYAIAQFAAKQHEEVDDAMELYVQMCEFAEQSYKTQHSVDNLREALPTWATYKSNVLRGLRLGLDPNESISEKQFRSKTMEQVSRSKVVTGSTASGDARAGPPALRQQAEVEEFVATTTIPDSLQLLISQVVYAAEIVKPAKVVQAEEILREAWQKLGSLIDRRRISGE